MTPEQGVDFCNRVHPESHVLETRVLGYPLPRKIRGSAGRLVSSTERKAAGTQYRMGHLDRDTAERTPGGSIAVLGLCSPLLIPPG
jgi:hypothetical protein